MAFNPDQIPESPPRSSSRCPTQAGTDGIKCVIQRWKELEMGWRQKLIHFLPHKHWLQVADAWPQYRNLEGERPDQPTQNHVSQIVITYFIFQTGEHDSEATISWGRGSVSQIQGFQPKLDLEDMKQGGGGHDSLWRGCPHGHVPTWVTLLSWRTSVAHEDGARLEFGMKTLVSVFVCLPVNYHPHHQPRRPKVILDAHEIYWCFRNLSELLYLD